MLKPHPCVLVVTEKPLARISLSIKPLAPPLSVGTETPLLSRTFLVCDHLYLPPWYDPLRRCPVVLSWGLGADSTALLLSFLAHPELRTFCLDDLVVITAHTGSEWKDTQIVIAEKVLPILEVAGIRVIQAARGGSSQSDGLLIISDSGKLNHRLELIKECSVRGEYSGIAATYGSEAPWEMHFEGAFTITEHFIRNAIVPQVQEGRRLCTWHFKGWVIDRVVYLIFGDSPRRRFIGYNADERGRLGTHGDKSKKRRRYLVGYNADEAGRVKTDRSLQGFRYLLGFNSDEAGRIPAESKGEWRGMDFEYPLISRGWGRGKVESLPLELIGYRIPKSCCAECCFSCSSGSAIASASGTKGVKRTKTPKAQLKEDVLVKRYTAYPKLGARAAYVEHIALAINPTQTLYGSRSARSVLEEFELSEAIDILEERIHSEEWAVYAVRRLFLIKAGPDSVVRQTEVVFRGSPRDCQEHVQKLASLHGTEAVLKAGSWRFWSRLRQKTRPYGEEMFVACPAVVVEKQGKLTKRDFAARWFGVTGQHPATLPKEQIMSKKSAIPSHSVRIPAISGLQGGDTVWSVMFTARQIAELLGEPDPALQSDSDLAWQRVLDTKRVNKIVEQYILPGAAGGGDGKSFYRLPSITMGFLCEDWEFEVIPETTMGHLVFNAPVQFFVYDGQHRAASMRQLAMQYPVLAEQGLGALLMVDPAGSGDISARRTIFADINTNAKGINPSQLTLFSGRLADSAAASNLMKTVPLFVGRIAWQKTSLRAKDPELFPLSSLREATTALWKGVPKDKDGDREKIATEFWKAVSKYHPDWAAIADGADVTKIRAETYSLLAVVLVALGEVGASLISQPGWENRLEKLKTIDWSKKNSDWESILLVGGTVRKSASTITSAALYILGKLAA